jgi:hypothetical protein
MMRAARTLRLVLVVPALRFGAGCAELGVGACEHTYRDPVLTISAATDAESGASITPLQITAVAVGGQLQPIASLLATAFGARAVGDTIVCDVPCGFGTSESRYALTAAASGYVARDVTTEARYARFEGGCPSYNSGSTRTTITLTKSSR